MSLSLDDPKTKALMTEIVVELLQQRRDVFYKIIVEALEEVGLAHAMEEGLEEDSGDTTMGVVSLSSDRQVLIPAELLATHNWKSGQEWEAVTVADGILLKPKKTFSETTLSQVAGCLKYQGKAKTLEEMEQAIAQGIEAQQNDCR